MFVLLIQSSPERIISTCSIQVHYKTWALLQWGQDFTLHGISVGICEISLYDDIANKYLHFKKQLIEILLLTWCPGSPALAASIVEPKCSATLGMLSLKLNQAFLL